MDVAAVVKRAINGDVRALEELIEEFQGMAVGYAFAMLQDHHLAEDAAQEAFIQAIRSMPALRNPRAFPSWFKTILRYTCIRQMRGKNAIMLPISAPPEPPSQETLDDEMIARESAAALHLALSGLSEEDRSILTLCHVEGVAYRHAANFLGISETRVNNRLHALRVKLRRELSCIVEKPKDKKNMFRKKVIEGVAKIGYETGGRPMLTQFCGSLSVALAALGADPGMDYAAICAVSGAAFRMLWKEGWHPDNVDLLYAMEDSFEPFCRAIYAAGYTADIRICRGSAIGWGHNELRDVAKRGSEEARAEIMASIDEGYPVLALGVIGPPECCVVTGYEDSGRILLGYNYFQDMKDPDHTVDDAGLFHKKNWFAATAAYILLKERDRTPIDWAEVGLRTIRMAVSLANTPVVGGRAAGLAAYIAMAEQLLHDEEYSDLAVGDGDMNFAGKKTGEFSEDTTGRFGMFCDPFLMTCERANAAVFLERIAEVKPEWGEELRDAAGHYRKVAGDPNALWKRLGLHDHERFRDPDVRGLLAAQVLRRRLHEGRAVACLQRLLDRVDRKED